MEKIALIVAGGEGKRMNNEVPKQFLLLNGLPILMHTLKKFIYLDKIILVLPSTQFEYWKTLCKQYNFTQKHILVVGGINRFGSVKNGLKKINDNSIVAIHDGVRPLISTELIDRLIEATKKNVGVIPIIPIKDSIRKVDGNRSVVVNRNALYKVQTPQCFYLKAIKEAYQQNFSIFFTDDASVFESYGGRIKTLTGEYKNLKITTEEDLRIAEKLG